MRPSNLDRIVGQIIQRYRIQKGWSQEFLAETAGLHRTYISQLERGLKSPSVRVFNHITNAFGVSMTDFMNEVEEALNVVN